MSASFQEFIEYVKMGNLQKVIEYVESKQVDASAKNNDAIIYAAEYGHLAVVEYLLTLPNVDASARNNQAIIWAAYNGHLAVVEYLSKLPNVDASALNNRAIIWAAYNGHLEVIKYLSTLPNVDASARDNHAIIWAARNGHLAVVAMLLYFELKVTSSLSDTSYKYYHQLLLSHIRPIAHKIAVSLTEFPTPLIIEVIEQSLDFAIYIPYHIKWNMVVAIKHSNCRKK